MKTPEESERTLAATKAMSRKFLEMPDKAIDAVFDDLLFLSSKKYSIDAGVGYFSNLGNTLYSEKDKRLFLIDVQPFLYDRVGIPNDHTKGFNTPFFFTQSILPGSYAFRREHNGDKELIALRTELIDKIIQGAERNHLSDRGGYVGEGFWGTHLRNMNIPSQAISDFDSRLRHIRDEKRYAPENQKFVYKHVKSRGGYS